MTCNGNNHRPDCTCNFRGGHPGTTVPHGHSFGWSQRNISRCVKGPNAKCPKCGAAVYYLSFSKGGGAYFDTFGPPWKRHRCMKWVRPYSPYNTKGQPKLRNKRSKYERDGWIPLIIKRVETLGVGTIIHGVAFDNPTILYLGTRERLTIDRTCITFYRDRERREPRIEVSYLSLGEKEAITVRMFENCPTEIELIARTTR